MSQQDHHHSPPLRARMDASCLASKPHDLSTSPPPPGSPMPPTASLNDVQLTSNSTSTTTSASAAAATVAPPPEVEATLTKLTSKNNVTGCLVLSRPDALIIRSGGKDFEPSGPGAHDRSEKMRRVVKLVKAAVDTVGSGVGDIDPEDDMGFIRIRTKKYEMMISPSDKYLLVVLQDPTISP